MTINTKIGKITASKDVLNYLSIICTQAEEYNKSRGYNASAEECKEVSYDLYNVLKEVGFYNDLV